MRAAQAILRSCLGRGQAALVRFGALFALAIVGVLAFTVAQPTPAQAAETCRFEQSIGGASQTEGNSVRSSVIGDQLCIGPAFGASASSGFSVFEFVVKFNGPVENADITFKNGRGNTGDIHSLSGNFQKVNPTTYVVKPEKKAGYVLLWNFQSNRPEDCKSDNRADITVVAKANGKEQQFTFNLCESAEFNRDYTFTRTADQIPPDGASGTGKGRIVGDFTTVRFGAPEGAPERIGRSQKRCVTSITLTPEGGAAKTGDSASDWYSLVNGVLEIPNLDPGRYDLAIVYNDRLCMQQDHAGSSPNYTVDNLAVGANDIEIKAGEETRITLVNQPPGSDIGQGTPPEEPPVCTTGTGLAAALSWVLCPVAAIIANATEFIEKNIILPYLTVSPLNTEPNNPAYLLWQGIRNVANSLFIVAFFIIIFSQATSIGINNYGIKRLLPRVALVAIGTNLSYFIVAFIIDTFNVFGAGVGTLVMQVLTQAGAGSGNEDPSGGQFFALGGAALIAVMFKAGPVLGWLFGLIGMAFLIIVVAVIVLVIRQLAIIMLVVVSPLAFVAWLLPNTEQYFSKWGQTLIQLLMMYPIIVLLFASGKILGALLGSPDYILVGEDKNASGDIAEAIRVILQFFVNALPLLLLIGTFAASGKLMSKATSMARNLAQKAGQRGSQAAKDSKLGQFAKEKMANRRTRLAATPASLKKPWQAKRAIGQRMRSSQALNRVTGGFGTFLDRENAAARRELDERANKLMGSDLNAAQAFVQANGEKDKIRQIAKAGQWTDSKGKTTKLSSASTQRLEQLANSGDLKGPSTARAAARVLADTNQLNASSYKQLAKIVDREGGAQVRDEFVDEQNVYNDGKSLPHLAQAGFVNGEFKQYAPELGLKSADKVLRGLRLGETKKQVFQDGEIGKLLSTLNNEVRINPEGAYASNAEYRNTVSESLKMKPDQYDNFVQGSAMTPNDIDRFERHRAQMRAELAGTAPIPGAGGNTGGGGGTP